MASGAAMSVDQDNGLLGLIHECLQKLQFHNASSVLADEANLRSIELSNKIGLISNLKKLVEEGEWAGAHKLLGKLVPARIPVRCFQYHLYREEYLELIESSTKRGEGACLSYLIHNLKPLEDQADSQSPPEFKELCYLLSCKSVAESNIFRSATHKASRRQKLACELCDHVAKYILMSATLSREGAGVEPAVATDRLSSLLNQENEFQKKEVDVGAVAARVEESVTCHRDSKNLRALLCTSASFRHSGNGFVVSNDEDKSLESLATLEAALSVQRGNITCVQFYSSNLVVAGTDLGNLLLWKLDKVKETNNQGRDEPDSLVGFSLPPSCTCSVNETPSRNVASRVRDLSVSPDGTMIVSALSDGRLLYSRTSLVGSTANFFGSITCATPPASSAQQDGGGALYSCCYNYDGKQIAFGGVNRRVDVVDAETRVRCRTFSQHEGAVIKVGFNAPTCNLVYSASRDGLVRFFDLLSGVCISSIDSLNHQVTTDGSSSPRSSAVATSSGGISSASLTEDGRYLLVTNRYCPPRLIDLRMNRLVCRFVDQNISSSPFYQGSFCAGDSQVALGTSGGGVRLWSAFSSSNAPTSTSLQLPSKGFCAGSRLVDDYFRCVSQSPVHRTVYHGLSGQLAAASEIAVAIWE